MAAAAATPLAEVTCALRADVALSPGVHSDHASETVTATTIGTDVLKVVTHDLPGDVSLAGTLPQEAVAQLASRYKGWLYLNPADSPDFFRAAIEHGGCVTAVVEIGMSAEVLTTAVADEAIAAVQRLPRPLMIQCCSGNRAGAALLLWRAKNTGLNAASAEQLARDLDMKFVTSCTSCGPQRQWVADYLGGAVESTTEGNGYVLEQLFDSGRSSTFTYLLGCRRSGESVLIDPVLGLEDRDLGHLEELGFTLKYVVNTHCHADHITSGSAIRKRLPEVRTVISEASGAAADVSLRHGDRVPFGQFHLEARSTPGHTDGCMTYVLRGPGDPLVAFAGDAVLIRGCGRTDFQQGDAGRLFDSVHSQVFSLPGATKLYPGHDYKGRNVTTVDDEKNFNARLTKTKEEFVALMGSLGLPTPKLMDIAVPANMQCGVQS